MVKTKRLVVDAKTGTVWEEEFDFTPTPPPPEPVKVDIEDLTKLIAYAKQQKWI
jgi:hypothetical protein